MSWQAVRWALNIGGLRPAIKLVLVAMADRADDAGGNCHPGLTELARSASTSRRRVVEAIATLEAVGAVRVQRSANGKQRNVNHYELKVGQEIEVRKSSFNSTVKMGTTLVPEWNHPGSPGCTVTTTELPLNNHSDTYVSARFPKNPRGKGSQRPSPFPDRAMITAAGENAERLAQVIAEFREPLTEAAQAGDPEARKKYRTLWFAILRGNIPDFEKKL